MHFYGQRKLCVVKFYNLNKRPEIFAITMIKLYYMDFDGYVSFGSYKFEILKKLKPFTAAKI